MSTDSIALFTAHSDDLDNYRDTKPVCSEDDVTVNDNELPMCLLEGQFDIVCVNSEKDSDKVGFFKHILEHFVTLEQGQPVEISTLDVHSSSGTEWIRPKFSDIDEAMCRSTFMFLFMTENFVNDELAKLMKDECIQLSIEDPKKKWCLVPLYMKPKSECSFRMPWGLRSLKPMFLHKALKGRSLVDVDINKIRKEDVDSKFLDDMTKLLNSRITLKLNRKSSQALAVRSFKNRMEHERKLKLMRYNAAQDLREASDTRKLDLQQESVNSRLKDEMKKIEEMNYPDLPDDFLKDIHRQKKTENRTLNTDLATLIDWFQKAGLSLDQALTIAKQSLTPSSTEPQRPIGNQTIVNINTASGIMIGNQNEQHTQMQPQKCKEEDTPENQERVEDAEDEIVEIERLAGASESRDDNPEESETKPMKLRQPIENMDKDTQQLKLRLPSDMQEKTPGLQTLKVEENQPSFFKYRESNQPQPFQSYIPNSPKPVAAVSPMVDAKVEEPDQTRLKSFVREGRNSAGNANIGRVSPNMTGTPGCQELDDDTKVKQVQGEVTDEDETVLKRVGETMADIMTSPLEIHSLNETAVKQMLPTEDEDITLLKTGYSDTTGNDTVVKEVYDENLEITSVKELQAASNLYQTMVKVEEGEWTPNFSHIDTVNILDSNATHVRKSASQAKGEGDTLVQQAHRGNQDVISSVLPEREDCLHETAVKTVEGESIPAGFNVYTRGQPVYDINKIRESGSSVDPYPYHFPVNVDDPRVWQESEFHSNSSTLVGRVSSQNSGNTLVPED